MRGKSVSPRLEPVLFIIAAGCSLLITVLVWGVGVTAQGDITAPVIVDIAFEPNRIDTSEGPATITVTVHVTDDLSGVAHVGLFFRKPETTQRAQVEFRHDQGWSEIIEGDALDGVHLATMTLPRYAAEGWWEMYSATVSDNVGNRMDFWSESDEWPFQEPYGFWVGGEATPTPTATPTIELSPTSPPNHITYLSSVYGAAAATPIPTAATSRIEP